MHEEGEKKKTIIERRGEKTATSFHSRRNVCKGKTNRLHYNLKKKGRKEREGKEGLGG